MTGSGDRGKGTTLTDHGTGIRLIGLHDAEVIADHLARDRAAFARWQPDQPDEHYAPAGQRTRIARLLDAHRSGTSWPAVVLAGDMVVGQVTVSTIIRGPFQKGFLGYWITTTHQGQGHATRAVGLALREMADELGLHRAEAHAQMENLASQRVLRSNGFTPFGFAHAHLFIQGSWRDEVFWERSLDH